MLFSTMPPKELPKKGDLVCYRNETRPWKVVARVKKEENVFLGLQSGSACVHRERIEVLDWYPIVGDIVLVSFKPYLEAKKLKRDFILEDWVSKEMELISVDHNKATVKPKGSQLKTVPFECLRVLKPCPR